MVDNPNNNTALISVIIPVFNTSQYLQRCINSLRMQTYQNIEMIFVDDGSTDDCVAIIRENMKKDTRINLITQKNQGPSAARNHGLDNSRGQYIMFCDSDDTVDKKWCESLLQLALQYPDSWITCGTVFLDSSGSRMAEYCHKGNLIMDKEDYWLLFKEGVSGHVWNKIFLASKIKENGLRFDESVCRGEDVIFNLSYLQIADSIVASDQLLYYYYQYKGIRTLTNTYHKDDIDTIELLYDHRYPFIAEKDMGDFQLHYWRLFSHELDKTFLLDRQDNWIKKIQHNQRIIERETFQELLFKYGRQEMHPLAFLALRKKLFILYWGIQKLYTIKHYMLH